MIELFKSKLSGWLRSKRSRAVINENSSLEEIKNLYPSALLFLEKKYSVKDLAHNLTLTLKELSKRYSLPPPQVLFMEIQLHETPGPIEEITALGAQHLLQVTPSLHVLDIRETWEHSFGSIPRSQVLDEKLFSEAIRNWPKNSPVLLYCHFGVRSRDAAHEFSKNGFTQLYVIRGGIDAWSSQVDPSIPRYSGAYC